MRLTVFVVCILYVVVCKTLWCSIDRTSFMNELFAFEVVLVAGAELKAVRDQLTTAEETTPVNDKKVYALKERVVDLAIVLQKKLETITPIVSFLLKESVSVIKNHHVWGEAEDETKKDK
ncbi:unnamed protein product [Peronospora belbahrii]|uniref:Uncharacterized protein n=1 Tax=Peronospora belbahrii TaxID=622444 RepID=A0ABN8D246_9STRA|nr:unnamed protein product [Peronospora belbahrii]